jgi:hypothetical protein
MEMYELNISGLKLRIHISQSKLFVKMMMKILIINKYYCLFLH